MRRLVLIRHGEANAFVERVVAGHGCTGLSDHGRRQAEALRDRLVRTGELRDAVGFHTSLMRRAAETAAIIAPAVGDGTLAAAPDCGFCEQHPNGAEGMQWDEAQARNAGFDAFTERDRRGPIDLESLDEMVERVRGALDREVTDGTSVIVCHGGVVGVVTEILVGVPTGHMSRYVENTSINEFMWDEEMQRWWLVRLNDSAHLLPMQA